MYSILISRIDKSFDLYKDFLSSKLNDNSKIVVIPWAFPLELDSDSLMNDYFKAGERRYKKYLNPLMEIGIKESNITILDCYNYDKDYFNDVINNSDLILIPGGNPEMLFSKIIHDTELLYVLKNYKGIILGESAGAEIQLKRYFITARNNYYKYYAFYDGIGIIDDPFYFDVHTVSNNFYLNKLQRISDEKNKIVYGIYDDGALIYNRSNNDVEILGNVKVFNPTMMI